MMTFPEKMWACVCQQTNSTGKVRSFLTHYGADKAFEKRKQTGIGFVQVDPADSVTEMVFDNDPTTGFTFEVSGDWNINKGKGYTVDVRDPRGFNCTLEAENIIKIAAVMDINSGVINGECVWGRRNGGNFLIPISADPYINHLNALKAPAPVKIKATALVPGDVLVTHYHKKPAFHVNQYTVVFIGAFLVSWECTRRIPSYLQSRSPKLAAPKIYHDDKPVYLFRVLTRRDANASIDPTSGWVDVGMTPTSVTVFDIERNDPALLAQSIAARGGDPEAAPGKWAIGCPQRIMKKAVADLSTSTIYIDASIKSIVKCP